MATSYEPFSFNRLRRKIVDGVQIGIVDENDNLVDFNGAIATGTGDVTGPAGATDGILPAFADASGKVLRAGVPGTDYPTVASVTTAQSTATAAGAAASAAESSATAAQAAATTANTNANAAVTTANATATTLTTHTALTQAHGVSAFMATVNDDADAATARATLGAGDTSGPVASIDSEIAVFSGTGGKTLKRATQTGMVKVTNGVMSAATGDTDFALPATVAGKVAGAAASVDSEIMLFSSTTGKIAKRATTTGVLMGTSGVLSAATAGTDYTSPTGTESLSNKTVAAPVLTGNTNQQGVQTLTRVATTGNVIVITQPNESAPTANATYTLSATIPDGREVYWLLRNASSPEADLTITIPSSYSVVTGESITSFVLRAGESREILFTKAGSVQFIYGEQGPPTAEGGDIFDAFEAIASAATVDLGTTTSLNVAITGSTTVTSFGTAAAGVTRFCRLTGSVTLTHNATSLICPGGANFGGHNGDAFLARSTGSGNWVVDHISRSDGEPTSGFFFPQTVSSSGGAPNIGAPLTKHITLTGTATVTSFGTADSGITKFVTVSSTPTLTYNATSLILPSAANIACAAGDSFVAVSLASGNWRVIHYTRASGQPLIPSEVGFNAAVAVASATTTDIGAAASKNVSITGTTTITGFGTVASGTYRQGAFAGALTLTHNATSLILPGGASVTTAAGDMFGAVSAGSGNWRVLWYTKADGTPLVSSSSTGFNAAVAVASAATTDIGAASSINVSITGTTTITSFGTVASGTYRQGVFTGVLTLTHNATSLILPGGISISTAAGDTFGAVSGGSGNWRVLWYQQANGRSLIGMSTVPVSIASATTTDIGAAASDNVSITGTTTITGFGSVHAGEYRQGVFTGALTLTHNATSLILPGGASITTAAGDAFGAISLSSGNWRVIWYTKANGTPLVTGFNAVATVASAATTDIGAASSNSVSITGTTTITAFGTVADGTYRQGVFTGALTLTHNATSLILPGGANITTAAGDTFGAISLGSGNWRVLWYTKAAGLAIIETPMTLATFQALTPVDGQRVRITDLTSCPPPGLTLVYSSTTTSWHPPYAQIFYLDRTQAEGDTTGADQCLKSILLPSKLFVKAHFDLQITFGKDGGTDSASNVRLRIHTAASSTSGNVMFNSAGWTTVGHLSYSVWNRYTMTSTTAMAREGLSGTNAPFDVGGATNATQEAITVPANLSTTDNYINLCVDMSGTTNKPRVNYVCLTVLPHI